VEPLDEDEEDALEDELDDEDALDDEVLDEEVLDDEDELLDDDELLDEDALTVAPPVPLELPAPPVPPLSEPKSVPESGKPQAARLTPTSSEPSAAPVSQVGPRGPLLRRSLPADSCAIVMLLMPSSPLRVSYRREHGEMRAALRARIGALSCALALLAASCAPGHQEPSHAGAPARAPVTADVSVTAAPPASAPDGPVPTRPPPSAGAEGPASSRPPPACPEASAQPGAWPRASGLARVVIAAPPALGQITQGLGGGAPVRLRFLGAHLFDLLGKLDQEGGATEGERRVLACAALEAAARAGAPVVRLWGSLKRTGDAAEVARAAELLALVVDENARRARPLRLVITLLNHQPGYGAPDPTRSLDDQDPASPWLARRIYLEGSWRDPASGLLAARIMAFRVLPALRDAPEILGWELVNELDTHRVIQSPAEAARFRDGFVVPALSLLAESFPQPVLLGDLRAPPASYAALGASILDALPPALLARLVWTSHVYAPRVASASAKEMAAATVKLDRDLVLASERGLPFLLGEIGQRAPGPDAGFCHDGPPHELGPLFVGVLDPPRGPALRREISMALFWGEGHCALEIPGPQGSRRITLGAGGDSADLGPGEARARERVKEERRRPRFRVE
jgi:hypothetical protein